MSQHDLSISTSDANTGLTFRAAVNAALQALGSCQSGGTAPTTTYPFMLWADTTAGILKMRNTANSAWITIGTLDAANLGLAVAASYLALAGGTMTGSLVLSGAGTLALHPASVAQVQLGAITYAVATGTADALVSAFSPVITTPVPGTLVKLLTPYANATTTPTLNGVTITRQSGALLAGDIKANGYSLFMYYTTGWMLVNPILMGTADIAASGVGTAELVDGAVTTAKIAALAVTVAEIADGAITPVKMGAPTAGDWIIFENNILRQRWPNTYAKVKEIKMGAAGVYRIRFTIKQSGAGGAHTVYGQIYVNGAAVGTERTSTSTTAAVYSQDITTAAVGDLIQIYSKSSANSNTVDNQADISDMVIGVASPIICGTLYGY